MDPVISAHGLVKRYGANTVLDGVTVDIPHGVVGLLGANGAGKTTLLGLILGLHNPDAGTITVVGLDPATAGPEVRARVGYAPEHHNLPPDLSAYDFVRHLSEIHGLPPREAINRASDALWQVGLGEERLRPVGTMSTGQRQRVKLAAALAHDPALILLDEPTDGLDPAQRDAMLALIRRVGTEFGIDIVLSSHLLDEVERCCDHVVILADRRVAVSGDIEELRGQGHGVIIELEDGIDAVSAALSAGGLAVRCHGSTIEALSTEDALSAEQVATLVRDVLANTGAPLRRLRPRRASLEDVFLAVGNGQS